MKRTVKKPFDVNTWLNNPTLKVTTASGATPEDLAYLPSAKNPCMVYTAHGKILTHFTTNSRLLNAKSVDDALMFEVLEDVVMYLAYGGLNVEPTGMYAYYHVGNTAAAALEGYQNQYKHVATGYECIVAVPDKVEGSAGQSDSKDQLPAPAGNNVEGDDEPKPLVKRCKGKKRVTCPQCIGEGVDLDGDECDRCDGDGYFWE